MPALEGGGGNGQPLPPTARVLIVEDDALFRRFTLAALAEGRLLSIEAEAVDSMGEARLRLGRSRFDCILLDLDLPDSHGLGTVRLALEAAPNVPIVVLTGQEDGAIADAVLRAGAQDFLEKDKVEPATLQRSIRHAVDRGRWTVEMATKNRELERRNRDLDDFAYAVTHDLKAPLRAIFHLVQEAQERLDAGDPPGARHALREVEPRIRRLFGMIDGVLRLSQAGRQRLGAVPVNVGRVVQEVVSNLVVPPGFQVRVASDMPTLVAEEAALRQVFQNLIDNAVKHNRAEGGWVEVAWRDRDGLVEFTVADNGPGIPPHLRERAFQLFQTLGPSREGSTGVGLALVRKVVEAYGGAIRIEESPAKGALFRFTWPRGA